MNVKFPNNTSKWQMEFNSAFKGLIGNPASFLELNRPGRVVERPLPFSAEVKDDWRYTSTVYYVYFQLRTTAF
jgi:hypothetical protein